MKIDMKRTGPSLLANEIFEFEDEIGYKLPEDYKQFLLKYNGGKPMRDFFLIPKWRFNHSLVTEFESLVPNGQEFGLRQIYSMKKDIFPLGFIPIGSDPGGNLILMSLIAPTRYRIYFWDHEFAPDKQLINFEDYTNIFQIAESFTLFIAKLKEEDSL